MILSSGVEPELDWLEAVWESLGARGQDILTRRARDEMLAEIANDHDVTRERVRQVQVQAEKALIASKRDYAPHLADQILEHASVPFFTADQAAALIRTDAPAAREALLHALGFTRPRTWAGPLRGWWTSDSTLVDLRLRELAAAAPLSPDELVAAVQALGLPEELPIMNLLGASASPLAQHDLGWIRRSRPARDIAYLWLRREGVPRTVTDIATITGTSEHATRETMRRDPDFAQVRPEGTWALSDWRLKGAESRYSSAEEVVVEVLRDAGPLSLQQLRGETRQRYPVTEWRIKQCLSSKLIGLNADGLYDLAERGANPVEDTEPQRPANIQESPDGNLVGIVITVNHDVLRGSGIGVPRWLTWRLGLRTAPSTRHFADTDRSGAEVIVRRATSSSSVSSLRSVALELGLAQGCQLVLLLRLNADTCSVRHTCLGACDAA